MADITEIKSINGYPLNDTKARQQAESNKTEIGKIKNTVDSLPDTIKQILNELGTKYGTSLDFDVVKHNLSLLNSQGEKIGESVNIKAGIDGLTVEVDENEEEKTYTMNFYDGNGTLIASTPLPATGGGGGGSTTTMRVRNLLSSNSLVVPYVDDDSEVSCILKYSFTSVDSDGSATGNGTVTYEVDGVQKYTGSIEQGEVNFDIGKYLKQGRTNTVKVVVVDNEDNKRSLTYSVTTTLNKIESSFAELSKQTDTFSIPYTPIGIGSKTVHFIVDSEEVATKVVTTSNREQYQTFSLEHGSHIIQMYMTTVIDGYSETVKSNTLQFAVMYCANDNETPILLVEPIEDTNILQYSQLNVNFMVYDNQSSDRKVECYVDDNKVTTLTVSDEQGTWKYRLGESGEHTFKLVFGKLSKEFALTVNEVDVAKAETSGLKFYFNPANRSNAEENPAQYSYTNEDGEEFNVVFNNMKFVDGLDGWTGNSLLIPVGSSIDIDYKPFEEDVTPTNGKTFEINFKVTDVYDYDTKVISCYVNEKGIFITPNEGSLAISKSNVVDVQFSDNEDIKISIVVTKRNEAEEGKRQLVYVYANGVISGVLKYSTNDNFSQINASKVHIGSDEATVEVYNARFYNVELSSYQILDNFIADAKEPSLMIERNNRNNIFNQNNVVDYNLLPKETPYLIIRCPELPQYKGDKKTGVSGEFVDKANPNKSFTFEGAEFDVQGTSSAGYYVKNFKGKFKGGFTINGEHQDNYALTDNDLPVATFCFKADVASSEGANNTILMKLWEETTPYKTEQQKADSRIRQAINGRPIVVYWENIDTGELSFRGKYNFNNDKSTQNTFGFSEGCECWEFLDNGLNLTEFSGDDFSEWKKAFEARYPDGNEDITNLKRVVSWVVSTDPNQATKNSLGKTVTYQVDDKNTVSFTQDTVDYRLAKFKYELEDYFIKTNILYYYFYTELFLMVDSRAKNQFLTTYDGTHWMFIPYDGDTALGIDNVGKLKFGYWLEDTDQVNGQDVYNGQQSVLWNNVRRVFADDITKLAQEVISKGKLNYEYVKNAFNNHQSAWSEGIFCADTDVKYIQPYLAEDTLAYLDMAQGSKQSQRDCWLRDRFQYIDSKYNVGSSKDEYITLRASQPTTSTIFVVEPSTDMHITPYKNTYLNVSFGQTVKQEKGSANTETKIVSSLDNPRDTPIYIYNASSIKSLGDLSSAYIGYCNVASATNLEDIRVGCDKEGYYNEFLTTLGLGNNTKLKLIDVRNCTNLSGEINAKGCKNIEEIYADNTKITSVSLPESGRLTTLSLPSTITSLIIKEQTKLNNFAIASYDNIQTLVLNNTPNIDSLDIVNKCNNLTNVTLKNIDWTLDSTDVLERLADLGGISENNSATKQSILTGKVHINKIQSSLLKKYNRIWKDLTVVYDLLISEFTVTFVDYQDKPIYVEYVEQFKTATDPVVMGYIDTPTKPSTVEKNYTYSRWSIDFTTSIISDTIVRPIFIETTRQYTVDFYDNTLVNNGKVIASYTVNAHDDCVYDKDFPIRTDLESLESMGTYFLFDSWDKTTTDVVQDLQVFPIYSACTVPSVPRMCLNKDKLQQGIAEGVYEEVDGVKVGVPQYEYLYTNDPEYTSCYTFEEFYAICRSDVFSKEYEVDSTGVKHYHMQVGDQIRFKLDSTAVIGGDPYGKGYGTIIFEVAGFNVYELADNNDFGEYTGQEIKAKFNDELELQGKSEGLYLNSKNGYVYHWSGTELSDKIIQYMAHIRFRMVSADSLPTSNPDKKYGHLIDTIYAMNTSNTNAYGWGDDTQNYKCAMNQWLNDGYNSSNGSKSVFSYLPSKLQRIIRPVKVRSSKGMITVDGSETFDPTTVISVSKLFLDSYGELYGTTNTPYINELSKWSSLVELDDKGNVKKINRYSNIINNNNNIRQPYLGTGGASDWWIRSPYSGYSTFVFVGRNGQLATSFPADRKAGVAFGFCI